MLGQQERDDINNWLAERTIETTTPVEQLATELYLGSTDFTQSDQHCVQLLNISSPEKWTLLASTATTDQNPIILDKDSVILQKKGSRYIYNLTKNTSVPVTDVIKNQDNENPLIKKLRSILPWQYIVLLPRCRVCVVKNKEYIIYDVLTMKVLKVIKLPRSTDFPVLVDDHTLIATTLSDETLSDDSWNDDECLFPDYFYSIDIDQGTVKEKTFELYESSRMEFDASLYAIGNGYAALECGTRLRLLIIDRDLNITVFQTSSLFFTVSVKN
jgi:hypothetical protein